MTGPRQLDCILVDGGGPNPRRLGACPDCGSYRADGRFPYLHHPGCRREDDLQIERWLAEGAHDDFGGPTIWK